MKRSIFIVAALISVSIVILYMTRSHMGVIESSIYKCRDGSELNFGGWWADPLPVPGDDNLLFVCGGNVPGEKKGIGTDRCVKVDLLSCTVQELSFKMSSARQDLRPTCLSKGQCYLFGGYTEKESNAAKAVDLLTLGDGSVTKTSLNIPQRLCYASAAIGDTRFIVTGGYGVKDPASGLGQALNLATLVDTADGEIESVPMNFERSSHSMTRLNDGKLLLIGGSGDDPRGAEVFDPATNAFAKIEAKMGVARKDHRAIFASDGLVYIMGGTSPIDKSQPRAIEVYDPKTKAFRTTAMELSVGREDIAAVYIEELNIIVAAGGEIKGAPGEPESSAIDLIDLNQNKVISGTLKSPKDEAHIIVRTVDSKAQTAKLLVLGMEKKDDREVPSPIEVVDISLSSRKKPPKL